MRQIQLSTGVQEIQIGTNPEAVVRYNPTDLYFVERVASTFDRMDALQQKYQGQLQLAQDNRKVFAVCREIDKDMRRVIDDLFDQPGISDAIFGKVSTYAVADGLPVWANLILAVMCDVDDTIAAEKVKTNPKLKQYLDKYKAAQAEA